MRMEPDGGWAVVCQLPASFEYDLPEDGPAPPPVADPGPTPRADWQPLVEALGELTRCFADEQAQRAAVEADLRAARREAELARVQLAQVAAELEAQRARGHEMGVELERERQRVEVLEADQVGLIRRLEDAWAAIPGSRRGRPLRLQSTAEPISASAPAPRSPEEELASAPPAVAMAPAASPELAEEIEHLRERLRARLHKPPDLPAVEAGVDRLREARLAREAPSEAKGRRRRS